MAIDSILSNYDNKFKTKEFVDVPETSDLLMDIFNIDPTIKRQNMQYWSRELGMCWQRLVVDVAQTHRAFKGPIRWGDDEPCDLVLGKTAIDTKYRVGSGDSGTLKKLKEYAHKLTDQGYVPVMLILRNDNLQSSVDACASGGWKIYTGQDSFKFIERRCGVDLQAALLEKLAQHRHEQLQDLGASPIVVPTTSPVLMPSLSPFAHLTNLANLAGLPSLAKTSPQEHPGDVGL